MRKQVKRSPFAHLHFQNNIHYASNTPPPPKKICVPVGAGADKHGQAGAGAPFAVVGCRLGGGEVGGAGARHRPAESEHGQHGLQHVPVHQVARRNQTMHFFY